MRAFLRHNHNVDKIPLDQPLFQDLTWFNTFFCNFNGANYYDKKFPYAQVHLDTCLTSLGGHFHLMVYALDIPFGYSVKYSGCFKNVG